MTENKQAYTHLFDLFNQYKFKYFQQKVQNIDRKSIIKFYIDNFLNSGYKFISYKNQKPIGLISFSKVKFLQKYFNNNIYLVKDFIAINSSKNIYSNLLKNVNYNNIDFLMIKIPVSDFNAINSLIKTGFYYVCTETYLSLNINKFNFKIKKNFSNISPCKENEILEVKKIASNTHYNIRYYYDDYFDSNKIDILYQDIIEQSYHKDNYKLFVYKENSKIIGFITIIINNKLSSLMKQNYASLDFIGVDNNYQNKNIGYTLNNFAIDYLKNKGINYISVKTMGSNYSALALLKKNNFLISSQNIILHKKVN